MGQKGQPALVETVSGALELRGAERAAYLDRVRSADAGLCARVEALLAHEEHSREALPTPPESGLVPEGFDPDQDPLIGQNLGGFTLTRLIDAGGMGRVYEAMQGAPRRRVAVKVLAHRYLRGPMLRRFAREAQLLGELDHPSVCRILAAGTGMVGTESVPYIAMEFVDGLSLLEAARGMDLAAKLGLMVQVCGAVEYAHGRGVIHRDLKPANILVERGEHGAARARVMDFGVAKVLGGSPDQNVGTQTGHIIGTLQYMSPEQAAGAADVDTRSDVYALGVILFELVSGRRPVESLPGPPLAAEQTSDPPRLGKLDGRWRGDLERIVERALERDRERRYASAGALEEDLRRFLAGEPIATRPPTILGRLWRLRRRHRTAFTAALATAGALSLGLVALLWQRGVHERETAPVGAGAAFNAYVAAVQAADAALRAEDVGAAQAELAGADPGLRGWEWSYLAGIADQSRQVWRIPGIGMVAGLSEENGRLVVWSENDAWTIDLATRRVTERERTRPAGPGASARVNLADGTVRITDDAGRAVEGKWVGVRARCAAVSEDGAWAAAGVGRWVDLWEVKTGTRVARLRGHASDVTAVAFSPGGLWSGSEDGLVRRWEVSLAQDVEVLTRGDIQTFGPGGFFGRYDSARGVMELGWPGLASPWAELGGFTGVPYRTALSRDRRVLVTAGVYRDGTLKVWDLERGTSITSPRRYQSDDHILTIDPAGRRMALAGESGVVRIFSLPDAVPILEVPVPGGVESVEFSPDGERIAIAYWPAGLRVCRASTGEVLAECDTAGGMPIAAVFSPDGRWLASLNNAQPNLNLWDSQTGVLSRRVVVVGAMTLTRIGDTGRFALGSSGGEVSIFPFDLPTGAAWTPLLSLWGREGCACSLIAAPDGSALVAKLGGNLAAVWRVREPVAEIVVGVGE